ncbi:hypothetical protein COHA_003832 [Chlorella ohadii]|uniref:SAM domain-containing protein n=1 Tax=Chlorella ohadii TaxID=2649997 RepID=A0AAD5H6B2_9CHLO|nr:hypothetical protein COHA_003832 [Chlorella ohadii]
MPEPAGDVASWHVPDVAQWLESLHFPPATIEAFKTNAVSGEDLLQLSDADLDEHLGLTPLLAPVAAAPATSARSTFNPADLDRYAELQQKTREMQGLQIPSKLAAAQQHSASVQSQLAAARQAVQTNGAALGKEEKNAAYYKGGGGGCCGLCKGKSERKHAEAEAQVARLREQLQQQQGRASTLAAEADEAQRQLAAWQGQAAEMEGAQRTMEGLVERMFASAGGRQAELADAARVLEGQAAEANRSADAFARGTQKLQNAAAALQEALAAMSRTQMLGAVNMGRGIGFQRRTGARARQMPGRPLGNVAEMAVFRRANDGVAQAARDASALLGPGMPRVDSRVLSTARAGMFANLLVGGTISSAVQLAAVRRSMDQVRSLLGEANLAGQAAAKRAEVDSIRRQELQEAVVARTAAAGA